MSSHSPTMMENFAAKWASAKPIALALGAGLVVGPIVSGIAGFQVTRSSAQAETRAAVVEQQAQFCVERARATLPAGSPRLDWSRSYEVARQFSTMPGTTTTDSEVAQVCARKLSG